MPITHFMENVAYNPEHVAITVMLENDHAKEIRIAFEPGQLMKEHKTAHPIAVMVIAGSINFTVGDTPYVMHGGDLIHLEANAVHALEAVERSVVRLTLSRLDSVARVNGVLKL